MHPIALDDAKCRISEGCFFALGSCARYKLQRVDGQDDAGSDYRLIRQIERNGSISDMGTVLDFQLKSTENWEDNGTHIKYSVKSKAYNDIVSRNLEEVTPLILIVMCLPEGHHNWINISEREIIFREKLYWFHTSDTALLDNEHSTKTILIPKENVLDMTGFQRLVEQFATITQR